MLYWGNKIMKMTFVLLPVLVIGMAVFAAGRDSDFKGLSKNSKGGVSDINWQYAYDDHGRVNEITSPGKRTMSFSYEDDAKTGLARRITRQDGKGTRLSVTSTTLAGV